MNQDSAHNVLKDTMYANHRRVFTLTALVVVLLVFASTAVLMSGAASKGFGWVQLITATVIDGILLLLLFLIVKRLGDFSWSRYMVISLVFAIFSVMRCCSTDAPENHVLFYIALVFSLFYFDRRLVIYSSLLGLILDFTLLQIYPGLMPPGNVGATLGIRYITFIMVTVAAAGGSNATGELLMLATDRENKALGLAGELQQVGRQLLSGAGEVASTTEMVLTTARGNQAAFEDIESAVSSISDQSARQAKDMHNSVEILSQITTAMHHVGETVTTMSDLSATFISLVGQGKKAMDDQADQVKTTGRANQEVAAAIAMLNSQSQEISEILDTISGIAQQTSLLALNAAIEAARAGESGRGFAVVADEVRKLAEESDVAAQNISRIIGEVQRSTGTTVTKMEESARAFEEQEKLLFVSTELFARIGEESRAIDHAVQDITAIVEEVIASTEEAAAAVKTVATTSQELAAASNDVQNITKSQVTELERINQDLIRLQDLASQLQNTALGLTANSRQ